MKKVDKYWCSASTWFVDAMLLTNNEEFLESVDFQDDEVTVAWEIEKFVRDEIDYGSNFSLSEIANMFANEFLRDVNWFYLAKQYRLKTKESEEIYHE